MRALRLLCGLVALGLLALGVLAAALPASPSSLGYLAALLLLLAGPALRWRSRRISLAGAGLLALVVAIRLASAPSVPLLRLPEGTPSLAGRLLEERDLSLFGARWAAPLGLFPEPEMRGVLPAMREAYAQLGDEGSTGSPVLSTLLGRQAPGGFDLLVFEPRPRLSDTAVIFLHGYTGNFALTCWLVAHAANQAGELAACPSAGFAGRWASTEGAQILDATVGYLRRERGAKRFVLGGLSNGGIGASLLAFEHAGELEGLLLVSGAVPEASPPPVPTLLLHGANDSMMSVEVSRQFASRAQGRARLVEVPEGHFALLVRRRELGEEITRWLRGPGAVP